MMAGTLWGTPQARVAGARSPYGAVRKSELNRLAWASCPASVVGTRHLDNYGEILTR